MAAEESAPGQAGVAGAPAAQGAVVAPGQARAATAGSASAQESAAGGAKGISAGMPTGGEAVPGSAASVAVPGASATETTGGESRETAIGLGVRVETTPAGVRIETAPSGAAAGVSATALMREEGVGGAAAGTVGTRPGKTEASSGSGESRAMNRAERSLGVHELSEERMRGEALSEMSNVQVEEHVARMSLDRAWNVNQADVLAVRKRTEEVRASNRVASQTVRNSAGAIRARREILTMSAPLRAKESEARGETREEAVPLTVEKSVSSASTRVIVTPGVTLVHVTAQNVTEEVVERPLVEVVLPAGMRYEALASAPPNTAVRVERTEAGEKVEVVLPFALFRREAVTIAVQTSPASEAAVSEVKARVRPLEEGLRAAPRGAAEQALPMGSEADASREHLHPRP